MASQMRSRLPPIHTHLRNVSTNTVESDSSDSSPGPQDEDFIMALNNDSSSTIGALATMQDSEMEIDTDHIHRISPIQKLPPELLIHIFSKLTTTGDLRNCMAVSYHWALYTVGILWHRPLCSKLPNLTNVCRTLSETHPSFPYHEMVKRLNLSAIADKVSDGTVQAFFKCKSVERLTLTSCTKLTDLAIEGLVDGSKRLQALDITDLEAITDKSMVKVAENCPKLQGLNITNCLEITDDSLSRIAFSCTQLKRLKLNGVSKLTDQSVVAIAENCRSILEIDLAGCQNIMSPSVTALLTNLPHLRELRLAHCTGIDSRGFTDLKSGLKFDALRILDLTACDGVYDDAIARIIPAAPRLRNLVLAKCRHITDLAVRAICTLTKNLHYIHLGHCQNLTDAAIIDLVQQCNRIRYIDLACCSKLTDASVRWLAKLPKLRRVGLVKCLNLTDTSIVALARGPHSSSSKSGLQPQFVSLERVHLSYCTQLTLKGITQLLINCPRLTHLSLTGVQAFLRDDLTRFCREAPTEFTHIQRDVFCVFSGEGVERLRSYLSRLALEQAQNPDQGQNAMDEPVLGPNSPEDSASEGTIDGNDPNHPGDFIFGVGRHGQPRMSSSRSQQRPRVQSFPDLPRPEFHIDMPILPRDQMQRVGPWTPAQMTPEYRQQLTPQQFSPFQQSAMNPYPTPTSLPRAQSPIGSGRPRSEELSNSRSQSRRHTMDASQGLMGYSHYLEPNSPPLPTYEPVLFPPDYMTLPTFQPQFMGHPPPRILPDPPLHQHSANMSDPRFSSFELNHDAIMSTIPANANISGRSSPIHTPRHSRVNSRSRLSNLRHDMSTIGQSTPSSGGKVTPDDRSQRQPRLGDDLEQNMRRVWAEQNERNQQQHNINYGQATPSRPLPPLLPPNLMEHVGLPTPPSVSGGSSSTAPERPNRRHHQDDVDMTQ